MNITQQQCSKKSPKRNVCTTLRGLHFDAFLSQDYLTKKCHSDCDGLFHLLESVKLFCENINVIAKSLTSAKVEIFKLNEEFPKSALLEFSNSMFVPVYKIFSLDPEEDNESPSEGTILFCCR